MGSGKGVQVQYRTGEWRRDVCVLGDEGERLLSIGNVAGAGRSEGRRGAWADGINPQEVDEGEARVGNSIQEPRFIGITEGKHSGVLERQMD